MKAKSASKGEQLFFSLNLEELFGFELPFVISLLEFAGKFGCLFIQLFCFFRIIVGIRITQLFIDQALFLFKFHAFLFQFADGILQFSSFSFFSFPLP